ncbi:stage II sporulation protein E [Bacillus pseudomycoides]|nr:stage II sporulation protein E [Bacillus pseudomycoides]
MKTIEIQASIEEKREELIELIRKYGVTHHRVITCSQELDILLYRLMEIVACTE